MRKSCSETMGEDDRANSQIELTQKELGQGRATSVLQLGPNFIALHQLLSGLVLFSIRAKTHN